MVMSQGIIRMSCNDPSVEFYGLRVILKTQGGISGDITDLVLCDNPGGGERNSPEPERAKG